MLSSAIISDSTTGVLALTRLAQRSLVLQPGNLLTCLKQALSVGFSMAISLHAATQARRLLAFTAAGLPSKNIEGHPMDHDSNSSGHANNSSPTLFLLFPLLVHHRIFCAPPSTKVRYIRINAPPKRISNVTSILAKRVFGVMSP